MGFRHLLTALLIFTAPAVYAAPPTFEPITEKTIADTGSRFYSFETLKFTSADRERNYRVTIATPKKAAPAEGYGVVYMLDGNAVVMDLNEDLLRDLTAANPPVIVAIGYETDKRFDVDARAFDYTPPAADSLPFPDPLSPKRKNGGAEEFYKFIENTLKSAVNAKVKTDPARQYLWGHSYGGLFALYVLFSHTDSYTAYVSADPSIWWNNGAIQADERQFFDNYIPKSLKIRIEKSGAERERKPQNEEQRKVLEQRAAATASVPANAAEALASRLNSADGISAEFRAYPELSHGGLIPVSVDNALRFFAELKD